MSESGRNEERASDSTATSGATGTAAGAITGKADTYSIGTGVGAAAGGIAGVAVGGAVAGPIGAVVGGPVGTLVGAAVGAVASGLTGSGVASGINPSVEDAYWRENYRSRPYVYPNRPYEDYQPAYRFGWESHARYTDQRWEQVEADLERGWENAKGFSRFNWNDAKHAVRDAWHRVDSSLAAEEDSYWRSNHEGRGYSHHGSPYDDYRQAYRYGWESRERYTGRVWEEVESDLEHGWEQSPSRSSLAWNEAKQAAHDAWDHVDRSRKAHGTAASLGIGGISEVSSSGTGGDVPLPQPPSPQITTEEGEGPGDRNFRRTPHMDIVPQRPLAPGDSLLVIVYADTEAAHDGEKASDISIDAPNAIRRFEIEVFLSPSGHFRIEGPDAQMLVLDRDRSQSELVSFSLRVVNDPAAAAGRPEIRAYFDYRHRPCGMVSREVAIRGVEASAPAADKPGSRRRDRLEGETDALPADLQVKITKAQDRPAFIARVSTPLLEARREWQTESWPLPEETTTIVDDYMANFTSPDLDDSERLNELRGAGRALFTGAPSIFQQTFWELIDGGLPLKTISIVSDEPNIPWELMVPWRPGHPRREPLGVEFNVGRWTTDQNFPLRQHLQLRDSVVVAPNDSDLKKAEDEVKVVFDRYPGKRIEPALAKSLDDWLDKHDTTLLHFVCHGTRGAVSQELKLQDGKVLNATRLSDLDGVRRALDKTRPLVFLNACDAGRTVPSLVGSGGLVKVFIEMGAAGVVAPLWSVRDTIAHEIAEEFYRRVKEEPETPFAAILRNIRKKAYKAGEDTYAAYCFYGDPWASAADV